MSKYIIELDYDLQRVVGVGVKQGTVWVKDYDVDDLEELCADYINEHYGSLQDDAYQRGLEDGKQTVVGAAELREKLEYQKGLEDGRNEAWEAVRKIVLNPDKGGVSLKDLYAIFGNNISMLYICRHYSASEAIEKLKAYEEKQKAKDDKIEVGDKVVWTEDENFAIVVTRVYTAGGMKWCDGVCQDGNVYQILAEHARKTGRHFDIKSILDGMRCGR